MNRIILRLRDFVKNRLLSIIINIKIYSVPIGCFKCRKIFQNILFSKVYTVFLCKQANSEIFRTFLSEKFAKISFRFPKVTSIGSKKSKFSESVLKSSGDRLVRVPNRILGPQHSALANLTGFRYFLPQKYYYLGKLSLI